MSATETSLQITTETLVSAHSGRETLLLRYDGVAAGSVAIDENDNGVVPTVPCDREGFARLADALKRPLPPKGESREVEIAGCARGFVHLISAAAGHEVILAALSERPYRFAIDAEGARLLGTAIRGSFGFWG